MVSVRDRKHVKLWESTWSGDGGRRVNYKPQASARPGGTFPLSQLHFGQTPVVILILVFCFWMIEVSCVTYDGCLLDFPDFFFPPRSRPATFPFLQEWCLWFGVPSWETSRTWGWDGLPWMAHSAFCRTILEALVYSTMFTETGSSGMAAPPPDLTWFTSANHNPPPFCGLVQEPAAHLSSVISPGGPQSAIPDGPPF